MVAVFHQISHTHDGLALAFMILVHAWTGKIAVVIGALRSCSGFCCGASKMEKAK